MSNIIDFSCPNPSNEDMNELQVNQFLLKIEKIPDGVFKVKSVNIPALNGLSIDVDGSHRKTKFTGSRIEFSPFVITLVLNESMSNYNLFYNWLKSINPVDSDEQFHNVSDIMKSQDKYIMPKDKRLYNLFTSDIESIGTSDASLYIVPTKDNDKASAIVTFNDLYPVAISDIEFIINNEDYMSAIVSITFDYDKFDFYIQKDYNI